MSRTSSQFALVVVFYVLIYVLARFVFGNPRIPSVDMMLGSIFGIWAHTIGGNLWDDRH